MYPRTSVPSEEEMEAVMQLGDQSHRKRLKGEQAQTLAQLQELHPSKKKTTENIEATDEEYEVERSLDKRKHTLVYLRDEDSWERGLCVNLLGSLTVIIR
jgi:hypothetical protein